MTYSRKLIRYYKRKYGNAKFIYFFTNPANNYNLGRLRKIKDLLDAVFTFVKIDAEKHGFLFLEADPFQLPIQQDCEDETDVFFVGADKGRLPILLDIFEKLNGEGLICDFWITGVPEEKQKYADIIHYNQKLTYEEVLQHDSKTRCIIEVLQDSHSYSSIRTIEALQYHKKLLTMNDTVVDQWFYRPEIIHVFHSADEISKEFIRKVIDDNEYEKIDIGSFTRFEEFIMKAMLGLKPRSN